MRITLAAEVWLRHEHLEYEQLVALADHTIDAEGFQLVDLHLKVCARCREDMRSFFAFREDIASELTVSYGPAIDIKQKKASWSDWWRGLSWPVRYAAVIAFVAVVVTSLALWKQRANSLQVGRNTPQTIEPNNRNQLTAPESRATNETRTTNPPVPRSDDVERRSTPPNVNSDKVVPKSAPLRPTLRDNEGIVAISETGAITGLDDVPGSTRRAVAVALRSQSLPKSEVLDQLTDRSSSLRGRGETESFSLISPASKVIVEDRPVFRWERFPRAENYRVYVTDSVGKVVVKSDSLEPIVTHWTADTPLKRDEIYSWSVVALVDGKEIVSPNASASEVRFKVLSSSDNEQLAMVRKSRSHLALAVFCAKVGLLQEAQVEFAELVRLNPNSALMRRLLSSLTTLILEYGPRN